jgi:hypothetical protein
VQYIALQQQQAERGFSTMLDTVTRQFEQALSQGRNLTLGLADQVTRARSPVETLGDRSLATSEAAHKLIVRILRQQIAFVEAAIEESSMRLKTVAEADSLVDLVRSQLDLNKAMYQRLSKAMHDITQLVNESRDDFGAAWRGAPTRSKPVPASRRKTRPASKKAAAKPAARRAKPAARRAKAKRPAARARKKATAKKAA